MEEIELKVRSSEASIKPKAMVSLPRGSSDGPPSALGIHRPGDVPSGTYRTQRAGQKAENRIEEANYHAPDVQVTSELEKALQLLFSQSDQHRHLGVVKLRGILAPCLRQLSWRGTPLAEFLSEENCEANVAILVRCIGDRFNSVAFEAIQLLAILVENAYELQWMLLQESIGPHQMSYQGAAVDYHQALLDTLRHGSDTLSHGNTAKSCDGCMEYTWGSSFWANQSISEQIFDFLARKADACGPQEHVAALQILTAAATKEPTQMRSIVPHLTPALVQIWARTESTRQNALRLFYILCKNHSILAKDFEGVIQSFDSQKIFKDPSEAYIALVIACNTKDGGIMHDVIAQSLGINALLQHSWPHVGLQSLVERYRTGKCIGLSHSPFFEAKREEGNDAIKDALSSLEAYKSAAHKSYLIAYLRIVAAAFVRDEVNSVTQGAPSDAFTGIRQVLANDCFVADQKDTIIAFLISPQALSWWPPSPDEDMCRHAESLAHFYAHSGCLSGSNPSEDYQHLAHATYEMLCFIIAAATKPTSSGHGRASQVSHSLPLQYTNETIGKFIQMATVSERNLVRHAALWLMREEQTWTREGREKSPIAFASKALVSQTAKVAFLLFDSALPESSTVDAICPRRLYPHLYEFCLSQSVPCARSLDIYTVFANEPSLDLLADWIQWFFSLSEEKECSRYGFHCVDGHSTVFRLFFVLKHFAAVTYAQSKGAFCILKYLAHAVRDDSLQFRSSPIDITPDIATEMGKLVIVDASTEYLVAILISVLPFLPDCILSGVLSVWITPESPPPFVPKSIAEEGLTPYSDTRKVPLDIEKIKTSSSFVPPETNTLIDKVLHAMPSGALANGLLSDVLQAMRIPQTV